MGTTRRDLLKSFLGLPFALQACKAPAPRLELEGALVGASADVGHRLREGVQGEPSPEHWQETDVAIVGAGVAGLTAAWRLLRGGVERFTVLELEPEVGGTARSGQNAVSAYPWGAHYLPVPLPHHTSLIRLLREMGIVEGLDALGNPQVGEEHLVREPEERFFFHGTWYEGLYPHAGAGAQDIQHYQAFMAEVNRWAGWKDSQGRRAFTLPIRQCSTDAEVTALDKISFDTFITQRGWTSWRLRWWLDYACRDDYGTRLETTSAWAGLFYFVARMPGPGQESAPLMTWPEGNGRLVQWLRAQTAAQIRTGALVTEVVEGAPNSRINVKYLDVKTQKLYGLRAKRVIFAAPLFLARYLMRSLRESPPAWASSFDHSPWAVANLTLNARPAHRGYPLCWDNVIIDSPSLGYVSSTHQSLRDHGPTVWTWYYPLAGEDVKAERKRLLETDWKGWSQVVLEDLRRAHPTLETMVSRLDVMRWGHAMVRPVPGLMWGGARQAASQPQRGIHFAHSDLSGMALFEEAHDHGVRAAEEVLLALGLPLELVP